MWRHLIMSFLFYLIMVWFNTDTITAIFNLNHDPDLPLSEVLLLLQKCFDGWSLFSPFVSILCSTLSSLVTHIKKPDTWPDAGEDWGFILLELFAHWFPEKLMNAGAQRWLTPSIRGRSRIKWGHEGEVQPGLNVFPAEEQVQHFSHQFKCLNSNYLIYVCSSFPVRWS